MRSRSFLCRCVAAGSLLGTPALAAQPPDQPAPPSDGPRLVSHGAPLSPPERAAYEALADQCPVALTMTLVGGTLSDGEIILIAVAAALAVVIIIILL